MTCWKEQEKENEIKEKQKNDYVTQTIKTFSQILIKTKSNVSFHKQDQQQANKSSDWIEIKQQNNF